MKNKGLNQIPNHVAIILDGNGRWAKRRKLPRTLGHRAGALNLKNIAIEASNIGIRYLSVYAFSTENWKRPQDEVDYLMSLPKFFEETFKGEFEKYDVKLIFSGRKDRLHQGVLDLIERVTNRSKDRSGMTLNVCIDYGARDELVHAAKALTQLVLDNNIKINDIDEECFEKELYTKELPDVDLLIRTSGEQRLSNFLLWQSAYAELYFTKIYWPAFSKRELNKAIKSYQNRHRKFGS